MPRLTREQAASAAAPTSTEAQSATSKGKPSPPKSSPTAHAFVELTKGLSAKVDLSTTIYVPEEQDQPYCCLDCVLMDATKTYTPQKFYYETPLPFFRLRSIQLLKFDDGREALYMYAQDYDTLGSSQKGKFLVVMHLPLKLRASAYKTETDAYYLGKQEVQSITHISMEPAYDTPDLDAFIKNYKPIKEMGLFGNLAELRELDNLGVSEQLMKCNTAGLARIDQYCREHLRQKSIIGQVRDQRGALLASNFLRLSRRADILQAPFEERYQVVTEAERKERAARELRERRTTPPRSARQAAAKPVDAAGAGGGTEPEAEPEAAVTAAAKKTLFVAADSSIAAAKSVRGSAAAPAPVAAPMAQSQPGLRNAPSLAARHAGVDPDRKKTRAEMMAALGARSIIATTKSARAPQPVQAQPPAPAPAPASAASPQAAKGSQQKEQAAAADAQEKKKRAARGAPDEVCGASNLEGKKRARKTVAQTAAGGEEEGADEPSNYKNASRKGMKYNTTKRQLEKLKQVLPSAAVEGGGIENDHKSALADLRRLLGLPAAGAESSAADAAAPAAAEKPTDSKDVDDLKEKHVAEMDKLQAHMDDELAKLRGAHAIEIDEYKKQVQSSLAEAEKQWSSEKEEMTKELLKVQTKLELVEDKLADANTEREEAFVRGYNMGLEKGQTEGKKR